MSFSQHAWYVPLQEPNSICARPCRHRRARKGWVLILKSGALEPPAKVRICVEAGLPAGTISGAMLHGARSIALSPVHKLMSGDHRTQQRRPDLPAAENATAEIVADRALRNHHERRQWQTLIGDNAVTYSGRAFQRGSGIGFSDGMSIRQLGAFPQIRGQRTAEPARCARGPKASAEPQPLIQFCHRMRRLQTIEKPPGPLCRRIARKHSQAQPPALIRTMSQNCS